MNKTLGMLALLVALAPGLAAAQDEPKDFQVTKNIATAVNRYSYFTIFDDVNVQVVDGVATLTGRVTQPYKKSDLEKRVAKVDGVKQVRNQMAVLPLSGFDDQLRYRIARAIYGNMNFWQYASMANPPIHIVVEHGRVTLIGVVQSDVDRMLARTLASQPGVFSVTSQLKTVVEARAEAANES
jgi:hyperosmotically inducible periplasmic protein